MGQTRARDHSSLFNKMDTELIERLSKETLPLTIQGMRRPDFMYSLQAFGMVFGGYKNEDDSCAYLYSDIAEANEWGFLDEKGNRFIPFGELRDWLLEHARNDKERAHVEAFDFDDMATRMSHLYCDALIPTIKVLSNLKRKYEELMDKAAVPVKQRKRARVDE
jgi:hypothetical protein